MNRNFPDGRRSDRTIYWSVISTCRVASGPAGLRPPSEVHLLCEIFRARTDVHAIAHFHHDLTTAFTLAQGVKLQPVKNHAVSGRAESRSILIPAT
jgi:ribulose-5-phosphate 4-epimerase/fuculose-1-phosphate aldolase